MLKWYKTNNFTIKILQDEYFSNFSIFYFVKEESVEDIDESNQMGKLPKDLPEPKIK